LGNFAGRSGRVAESLFFFFLANVLLVVAIARYDSSSRLAPHPATAAKLPNLFLRGAIAPLPVARKETVAAYCNFVRFRYARLVRLKAACFANGPDTEPKMAAGHSLP
jgi:hypothetical protein